MGLVRVWDFDGTPEKRVLRGHSDPVRCLTFHPSEPLLASGSHDRTVRFWDIRSGTQISKIQMGERIQSLAFCPDGIHFAAATRKSLRVWQIGEHGERTVVLSLDFQLPTLQNLCFSPDGQWMAVGAGLEFGRWCPVNLVWRRSCFFTNTLTRMANRSNSTPRVDTLP